MSRFEKLKGYYLNGYWTKRMLLKAVEKGWISRAEFEIIASGEDKENASDA